MEKEFVEAARKGDLEAVKQYVQLGVDIHYNLEEALRLACLENRIDVVKYLIESGADVHESNEYPLFMAISYSHDELIGYLIRRGADLEVVSTVCMSNAIRLGIKSRIKLLLELGAKPVSELLEGAVESGSLEIVRMLLDAKPDMNLIIAFEKACTNDQIEIARYFLDLGINPSECNPELSLRVAKKGYLDVLKLLLNYDFSLHIRILNSACIGNSMECVKFLLDYGFDISTVDLYVVIDSASLDLIKFLVQNGAEVNYWTLRSAIVKGDYEKFIFIYKQKEWDPEVILDYIEDAIRYGYNPIIYEFLLKHHNNLIDSERAIELYDYSLKSYRPQYLQTLFQYVALTDNILEKLKRNKSNYTINSIKLMQSKGYLLDLEIIEHNMTELD